MSPSWTFQTIPCLGHHVFELCYWTSGKCLLPAVTFCLMFWMEQHCVAGWSSSNKMGSRIRITSLRERARASQHWAAALIELSVQLRLSTTTHRDLGEGRKVKFAIDFILSRFRRDKFLSLLENWRDFTPPMHQCVLVQHVNPLATSLITWMHPPVKGPIGGHGPVVLDLAGQVPQNCETVQGFKSNGLRQKKRLSLNFSSFNF